jgi:hypothetical protein
MYERNETQFLESQDLNDHVMVVTIVVERNLYPCRKLHAKTSGKVSPFNTRLTHIQGEPV